MFAEVDVEEQRVELAFTQRVEADLRRGGAFGVVSLFLDKEAGRLAKMRSSSMIRKSMGLRLGGGG